MPSGGYYGNLWKDILVHEIVHLTQYAEGGFRFSGASDTWFTENFANTMAEVINNDLNEFTGVSPFPEYGLRYGLSGCGMLESPWTGWMFDWLDLTGYVQVDGWWGNYCSLGYILWDFIDDDNNNPYNNWSTNLDLNYLGVKGDERNWPTQVRISGKTLWDAFGGNSNIYNLQDVYNVLRSLDLNNNGVTGEQNDIDLADLIFSMHGVAGGLTQL